MSYLKLLNPDVSPLVVGAQLGADSVKVEVPANGYVVVQEVVGKLIQENNASLEVVVATKEEYLAYRAAKQKADEEEVEKAEALAKAKEKEAKEEAKLQEAKAKKAAEAEEKAKLEKAKELDELKAKEAELLAKEEEKAKQAEAEKHRLLAESLAPLVKQVVAELLEEKVDKKKAKKSK